ncbi:hypothetical protein ACP70R_025751 [Stipagrostis hirtigluma subsp. patula]
MASVGFGSTVAAVAPASSSPGRGRRSRPARVAMAPAATRGGKAAAPKEEKSLADFIFGAIFKKDQLLVETDPLLNKVDGAPAGGTSGTRGKTRGGTTGGVKKAAAGGDDDGGFNLGGLFAKKG